MIHIGFITTSRADFGIYLPLIQNIRDCRDMSYRIFAGGMHTSEKFGNSYRLIESNGLTVAEKIDSKLNNDTPEGLSISMGHTLKGFGKLWSLYKEKLSTVFVLGDRFEMFAAAASLVPFNIPISHLHGGETTLGAIDNKFRHAITSISDYHFTSNLEHKKKVEQIVGSSENIYNVGAMGLDKICEGDFLTPIQFQDIFNFDVQQDFLLMTFHPETVSLNNESKIESVIKALKLSL